MADVQPPPLPVHLINLTLQYLLPPTAPIPPHLLSKDLLQRHHFLGISPDDPASYFCWPTFPPSASSIIQDLELRAGNEHLLNKEEHYVQYDHDDEGSRARVRLSDELDLYIMFVWQGSDEPGSGGESGWRYYDTKRLSASSVPASANATSWQQQPILTSQAYHDEPEITGDAFTRSSSPSSDAYWDNYGASSSRNSPNQPTLALPQSHKTEAEEEAAYWAAYSTVQGTADSTIPSRVPSSRNLDALGPHTRLSVRDPYAYHDSYRPTVDEEQTGENDGRARPALWALGDDDFDDGPQQREWEGSHLNQLGLSSSTQPSLQHEIANEGAPGVRMDVLHDADERVFRRLSPPSLDTDLAGARERRRSEERDATDATALARALFPVVTYQNHLESLQPSPVGHEQEGEGAADEENPVSSAESTAAETNAPSLSAHPENEAERGDDNAEADGAVGEAVRGVYKLWLAQSQLPGRAGSVLGEKTSDVVSPNEAFLALVAKAISH